MKRGLLEQIDKISETTIGYQFEGTMLIYMINEVYKLGLVLV